MFVLRFILLGRVRIITATIIKEIFICAVLIKISEFPSIIIMVEIKEIGRIKVVSGHVEVCGDCPI